MKVILFPSSVDLVGVSVHVLNLARALAREKLLYLVICPREGWLAEELAREQLPVRIIETGFRAFQYPTAVWRLFRELIPVRNERDVVVHLHGRFPLLLAALPMFVLRGIKFVATVHQFMAVGAPGLWRWKLRAETLLLQQTHRIWCVSRALQDEVIARIGPQLSVKVDTIPNWIEITSREGLPVVTADNSGAGKPVRVCAIGSLIPEKGFDILVEAVAIVLGERRAIHCDIFGAGECEASLRREIISFHLEEVVCLRGSCSNIRSFLSDYQAVIIPSRSESFSLVALEAFDAGVPVIASDLPGVSEVVIHEITGLTFAAGSARSLAESMAKLFDSPQLKNKLVENAWCHLERFVHRDTLSQMIKGFYWKALS